MQFTFYFIATPGGRRIHVRSFRLWIRSLPC